MRQQNNKMDSQTSFRKLYPNPSATNLLNKNNISSDSNQFTFNNPQNDKKRLVRFRRTDHTDDHIS